LKNSWPRHKYCKTHAHAHDRPFQRQEICRAVVAQPFFFSSHQEGPHQSGPPRKEGHRFPFQKDRRRIDAFIATPSNDFGFSSPQLAPLWSAHGKTEKKKTNERAGKQCKIEAVFVLDPLAAPDVHVRGGGTGPIDERAIAWNKEYSYTRRI
jgi:hypothetical protein